VSAVITTADEQRNSPIGDLYPYLQHRQSACQGGCVCGARAAVLAVEQQLSSHQAAADELAFTAGAVLTVLGPMPPSITAALAAMWAALDDYNKLRGA
jgi:hypothetical protein